MANETKTGGAILIGSTVLSMTYITVNSYEPGASFGLSFCLILALGWLYLIFGD